MLVSGSWWGGLEGDGLGVEYCVPTSRTRGWVRGCTYLVSYSWRTSFWMTEVSLLCWEKLDWRSRSWVDSRAARTMVVTTVMLGRGSCGAVGRKRK